MPAMLRVQEAYDHTVRRRSDQRGPEHHIHWAHALHLVPCDSWPFLTPKLESVFPHFAAISKMYWRWRRNLTGYVQKPSQSELACNGIDFIERMPDICALNPVEGDEPRNPGSNLGYYRHAGGRHVLHNATYPRASTSPWMRYPLGCVCVWPEQRLFWVKRPEKCGWEGTGEQRRWKATMQRVSGTTIDYMGKSSMASYFWTIFLSH